MNSARPRSNGGRVRVAYLCSAYPAPSHTFVLREVVALRKLGVSVETFSVRKARPEDLLSAIDGTEAARTQHLLPMRPAATARALLRLLRSSRSGAAFGRAARDAWRMRRPGLRGTLWQAFYLAEAILLWEKCARGSIRHVHAHFANAAADVAVLAVALGTALTPERPWGFSFTMHGPAEFWEVERSRLAEKVRHAVFTVCISDFARSQLMALTEVEQWSRLHVVHCALDVSSYGSKGDSSATTTSTGGPPILLTVGRLVPVKGQALVIECVARLRDRGLTVAAEIVGEGPMRKDLERLIAEHGLHETVILRGALGQEQLAARLQCATVFVLPSFAEGVPVVAMEAMAMGVPVVTTRIAGIPELIDDGVSGVLVTPGRVDELADAVEGLLADPGKRVRISSAAHDVVAAHFESAIEAPKLASLFGNAPSAQVS